MYRRPLREKAAQTERQILIYLSLSHIQYIIHQPFFQLGADVIFIALGYNIGGPVLLISVLTLVVNLILTIGFVYAVKHLALKAEETHK